MARQEDAMPVLDRDAPLEGEVLQARERRAPRPASAEIADVRPREGRRRDVRHHGGRLEPDRHAGALRREAEIDVLTRRETLVEWADPLEHVATDQHGVELDHVAGPALERRRQRRYVCPRVMMTLAQDALPALLDEGQCPAGLVDDLGAESTFE